MTKRYLNYYARFKMLGNFSYSNPTKLYFGEDSLDYLNTELPKYGKKILLTYGGGSIKKNGIYDAVVDILKKNGKEIVELPKVYKEII